MLHSELNYLSSVYLAALPYPPSPQVSQSASGPRIFLTEQHSTLNTMARYSPLVSLLLVLGVLSQLGN